MLLTQNLYLGDDASAVEDSEMRALRMELMMPLFHTAVWEWSYEVAVERVESQASLQICFRRVWGTGWGC